VILEVEGRAIDSNEALIRDISARQPGTVARLEVMRESRRFTVPVKLAERPARDESDQDDDVLGNNQRQRAPEPPPAVPLGLSVRELDRALIGRMELPEAIQGVIVSRVDPTGAAFSAAIRRGFIIIEINRRPVRTVADYLKIVSAARPGEILAIYYFDPTLSQRALATVTVE
jgi:serine protease Do